MDAATAVAMRASTATTSGNDSGGRGDGGCSDSGIYVGSGDDNKQQVTAT